MKSDQELKQKFKVFIDESGIANLVFLKEETDPEDSARIAELVEQAVLKILNENPQKSYNGIVDLLPLGEEVSYLSKTIRGVYSRAITHKQIKNVAIVGSNIFYKVATNFIIQMAGKGKSVKWFSNKEEALRWLKKGE